LRSIGHIAKLQNIKDNDDQFVPAHEMLRELMNDNKMIAASMRECHELAEKHEDAATAGLLETFIDETEPRTWFLFEASRTTQRPACRHSGSPRSGESGIHIHSRFSTALGACSARSVIMDSGLLALLGPGMTGNLNPL
jgi:Ferritin-like domain